MTSPRLDQRTSIKTSVTDALRTRGFLVHPAGTGLSVNVGTDAGYLGTLRFWSVYTSASGLPGGHVEFDPITSSGDGRYKVGPMGSINIDGLVRRLKAEVPKVAAHRAQVAANKVRQEADKQVLDGLWDLIGEDRENDVVSIEIYKGLVDIKLNDITARQAEAVLVALKAVL